jgi:uncharacterized membrane protein
MGSGSGALRAFLCVGIAYFFTAVVIPVLVMLFGPANGEKLDFTVPVVKEGKPDPEERVFNWKAVTFATLGGVAGAAGALCIIFSIKFDGKPLYVAPLVFAGAPIVNAIVSIIWHPPEDGTRSEYLPGWLMFGGGILLAAIGAGLVLYSKGYIDQQKARILRERQQQPQGKVDAPPPPIAQGPETGIKPAPPM